ncbi:MAG: glycosyltransferase [Candidatus Nanopelagicales bacterium]|nr:glycosyltransferase [Candidatus Nanopelagicales bacterium]MCF8536783.1 glycosyltransferase [Candidatus Nanopelagicales bacterium]MCF8541768.1 glycosyltransferase [Candidatus Nanopelagicales bacterium]MCF8556191.1 glycosyltransferase [Candidatus Nanopelagicales bacterium]
MDATTNHHTWLSVITVLKDDPDGFARTLESVASQDLLGVEYVVIDSSLDRNAIEGALAALHAKQPDLTIRYKWMEPRGIYAAMNLALDTSLGTYAYFANAGDHLHGPSVLRDVRRALADEPIWAFGGIEIVQADGMRVVTPRWEYRKEKSALFSRGHFPPHQGTFVRRDVLQRLGGFDTSYLIVADYHAFLRLAAVADPLHLDMVVATFFEGGVSTDRWRESLREFHRARREVLAPKGFDAVRELVATARQAAVMSVHRGLRSRGDRP